MSFHASAFKGRGWRTDSDDSKVSCSNILFMHSLKTLSRQVLTLPHHTYEVISPLKWARVESEVGVQSRGSVQSRGNILYHRG